MATAIEIPGRRHRREQLEVQLNLSIIDVSGEVFSNYRMAASAGFGTAIRQELVNELASCDGIIFFFAAPGRRIILVTLMSTFRRQLRYWSTN